MPQNMKPLLISTSSRGGAATACLRLHEGLQAIDIDSQVLVKRNFHSHVSGIYGFSSLINHSSGIGSKISHKTKRVLRELKLIPNEQTSLPIKRKKGLSEYSLPVSNVRFKELDLYQQADIINLHWVAGFLDYESFFKRNDKPLIWTLHDENPFTGGEHYSETFLGIDDKGYPKERVVSGEEKKIFQKVIQQKKNALRHVENLTIVSPSNWLAEEARKSEVFAGRPVHAIPYGLNQQVFQPRNKQFSRELLGIPKDQIVILFVADSIENERKGYRYLKGALKRINNPNITLCAIGSFKEKKSTEENIIELGKIQDERIMSVAYSAADVFVIPSLMDNLPNTVLESLMCGTPVIGFPIGGIPDMVSHKKNGLLTENISIPALHESLEYFIENLSLFDSQKIRQEAQKKYSLNIQAKAYRDLFKQVISAK